MKLPMPPASLQLPEGRDSAWPRVGIQLTSFDRIKMVDQYLPGLPLICWVGLGKSLCSVDLILQGRKPRQIANSNSQACCVNPMSYLVQRRFVNCELLHKS